MARIYIKEHVGLYWTCTYRGLVAGPFLTYDAARNSGPSQIRYKRSKRSARGGIRTHEDRSIGS